MTCIICSKTYAEICLYPKCWKCRTIQRSQHELSKTHTMSGIICKTICILWSTVVPTQVEKMREELANLNHCAVPFLSRAAST